MIIVGKHGHWPRHLWLRLPIVSSRNLKFVHGPAVDKFFTREIIKIAIRAPNPEIWPRLKLIFETSIRLLAESTRFPLLSFKILNLRAARPLINKLFTREIVEIAIRAPNPQTWRRLNEFVFETSI